MSIYQSTKVAPYVYWLTHKTTSQFYIGYREANLVPSDQDLPIYKSSSNKIDELGFENFDFQIIAEFFDGDSAWYQEQRIIEANIKNPLCLNGHFIKDGLDAWKRTGPLSEEAKTKISTSLSGKKLSIETRNKISIANKGDNCKLETRQKMSKANKGKIVSEETKAKMRLAAIGRTHTKESKAKMSTSRLKLMNNPEEKQKMINSQIGKKHSDETKDKISKSMLKINLKACITVIS